MNGYLYKIVSVLAILGLLGGALLYYSSNRSEPIDFETSVVSRGQVLAKVLATGTLSALVTVQVGSQVSGRIQALYADFNSPVHKGQLIAKIDPQLFEATVGQARANYLAAQGNYNKAKVQMTDSQRRYQRAQALAERKLIAQAELDTAQADADVAQAQIIAAQGSVEQARAGLHQAQTNLAYTQIISPIDGVVISRNVDVGQTVAASLQAPTLFTIAEDLRKMQVDTSVAEADVGKLRSGMTASFSVDAYPETPFTGLVRQIRNAPQTVQNVVTYDAVIDVDNADLKLKPGMTANVAFIYAEKQNVLRISNAALRFRPPRSPEIQHLFKTEQAISADEAANRRTVWILENGQPTARWIQPGVTDGSFTEIRDGNVENDSLAITEVIGLPTEQSPNNMPSGGMRRIF